MGACSRVGVGMCVELFFRSSSLAATLYIDVSYLSVYHRKHGVLVFPPIALIFIFLGVL